MRDEQKSTWMHTRVDEGEKTDLAELARLYGVSRSAMLRLMLRYFTELRPVVSIQPRERTTQQDDER